jgi:hypothetical protein
VTINILKHLDILIRSLRDLTQQQAAIGSQEGLQLATAADGAVQHGLDAGQTQLPQPKPQLDDLRWAAALQPSFAAVDHPPTRLHVRQTGGKRFAEQGGLG